MRSENFNDFLKKFLIFVILNIFFMKFVSTLKCENQVVKVGVLDQIPEERRFETLFTISDFNKLAEITCNISNATYLNFFSDHPYVFYLNTNIS